MAQAVDKRSKKNGNAKRNRVMAAWRFVLGMVTLAAGGCGTGRPIYTLPGAASKSSGIGSDSTFTLRLCRPEAQKCDWPCIVDRTSNPARNAEKSVFPGGGTSDAAKKRPD